MQVRKKSDSGECIEHASITSRNTEYTKYDPPGAQVSNDALAQKYLLYTPPSRLKRKIKVSKIGIYGRISSQCHALHRRPNSDNRAKEDNDNGPAGSVGCGVHFGGVGALMGSGVMTTTTTKINDDACPPQVIIAV